MIREQVISALEARHLSIDDETVDVVCDGVDSGLSIQYMLQLVGTTGDTTVEQSNEE